MTGLSGITISSGLATLYNIVGLNANIKNIKCDTLVVDKCVMNSINKVFVGSGTTGTYLSMTNDLIEYSMYSKKYAVSTIVHTGTVTGRFYFNSPPSDLNIGQIIYFYNPDNSYLVIDGYYNAQLPQSFLYNGNAGQTTSEIIINNGISCQLIYIGNNKWISSLTYPPTVTGTSTTTVTNTTYLDISLPSFPTNIF
jgi:hypothetical protein